MLSKLMKWFSSDRSEEPSALPTEVSSTRLVELRAAIVERFKVFVDEPTMREVVRLTQKRQKIEAIKQLRLATRQGLKESKDVVDHIEELLKKSQ